MTKREEALHVARELLASAEQWLTYLRECHEQALDPAPPRLGTLDLEARRDQLAALVRYLEGRAREDDALVLDVGCAGVTEAGVHFETEGGEVGVVVTVLDSPFQPGARYRITIEPTTPDLSRLLIQPAPVQVAS